ncbi:hypothetical protein C5167_037796 [Papaver somniferum]|uniref:Cytochrome P450 n=1 Tax=Papaver somniferum TaxID=3469 RepID=A0A4Y7IBG4_PAPSO|nr:hypothetical protein C5167_037796 [Papaver somniferum]
MAKQIMKVHDLNFSDRGESRVVEIMTYNYKDMEFAPYGDYWRQMRKIFVVQLLSTNRVKSFRSLMEEEVSNLIKNNSLKAESHMHINLGELVYSGKICKHKVAFISLFHDVTRIASGFTVDDLFPSLKFLHAITGWRHKLEMLHKEIDGIMSSILDDHRQKQAIIVSPGITGNHQYEEDFVDTLLRLQADGGLLFPFTDDNIKAVMLDIFGAGSDTASVTVEWAMSELLKNPEMMKKAQAEVRHLLNRNKKVDERELHELSYLKQVIHETLRLHPPNPLLLPRQCREICEINGYEIPEKTKVIINYMAIGRDPEYWCDAEIFKPERFEDSSISYKGTSFEYIPFGAGRRRCPGMGFGMAMVELMLSQLLYHFDWKLANGVKPEDFRHGLKFEGARTDNCNTFHAKENLKGRYLKMKQVKWMC